MPQTHPQAGEGSGAEDRRAEFLGHPGSGRGRLLEGRAESEALGP